MRRGISVALLVAAAVVIAGCTPKFDGKIKGVQKGANKVQVKFKICLREFNSNRCSDEPPERGQARRGDQEFRHLIAFRAPKGTKAPARFKSGASNVIRYSESVQYGKQLEAKGAPTPRGTEWFGYISKPVGSQSPRARYRVKFGLPNNPGKRFKYRPVTGYAVTEPGENKVNCGENAFDSGESGNAACITDPLKRKRVRKSLTIKLD